MHGYVHQKTCTIRMFIATLFVETSKLEKSVTNFTMVYNTAMRINKLQLHTITWTNLTNVILSYNR